VTKERVEEVVDFKTMLLAVGNLESLFLVKNPYENS